MANEPHLTFLVRHVSQPRLRFDLAERMLGAVIEGYW